ncbi:MAG: hypothetical protein AB8I08_24400, partial [Sandaracinaceae bacterium]
VQGRDMLCDVLLEAGATLEAIPILRERIAQSGGPARAGLLRTLATVLEEQVGDSEGAFVAWAELLETEPSDLDALSHMVSIDEAAGEWERLLSTLSYKVEVIPPEQQPAVLAKMAAIADESLADLARAAELYARALERAPGNGIVLDALCSVYERSDRYKDLVVLLRETAIHETDARRRAELYRRIARTLAGQVGNDDAAAEAWREVLKAGEDEEALRFLHRHAARRDHVEVLEDVLSRLSTLVTDPNEQREVLLDRAHLLADRLERPRDAILDLRKVVEELAPEDLGALTKLSELCEAVQDLPGLADALWRQLDVLTDQDLRVPVARRLADLHEKEAPEVARAVDALSRWADADPTDPVPMRRLVSLLESASRWAELCTAVDRLAGLEPAEEASRLVRKSAEVAYRQLGDVDGAWARLAPRVRDGDADAEADLRTLAEGSGRGAALSELYVELAQTLPDPADQKRRWMDAAQVQESALGDPKNALEAVLRAFAVDLEDEGPLDEADRLAELAGAWPRLAQVYETLIRQRDAAPDKVRLLLRHAALLDTRANDTNTALDHTLRAYSLSPADDEVLALAEERAARAGRADELLVSYDKRRSAAEDDAGRVEALLRSVRWSEKTLLNRELATQYLAQAVALTVRTPEQAEPLEAGARALDAEPGGPGAESGLRQALVTIYAMLADDMEENPVGGAQLLHRASRLLADDLGDSDAAFAAIKKAAAFAPADDTVLDALEAFALRLERLEALDQHFAFLIDEALDSRTAAGLLRRRANLLEQKLGRYEDAAEVWSRLASVDSSDTEARDRLRNALRKAGKHQDLLVALQRDLRRADPEERIPVLIRIAEVWDQDIQNRWEAIDAWKKVLAEAPGHPTATASMARLERASKRPQPDSDLMIDAPPDVANAELVSDDLVSAELVSDDLVSEDLVLSDSDLASAEPGTDQHALPPVGDDFDDLTMNSDETEIPDSSETLMDDGLRADLVAELSAPAALPDVPSAATADEPAEDDDEDSLRPPPRRGVRTAQTAQLRPPREGEAPPLPASRPAIDPNRLLPGPPGEFEDDYTAVADDVFDQLRPSSPDDIEVLGTGEIELFDEPAEDETMDMPAQRLPDLEQEILGAAPADDSADSVESLDDPGAFEELGAIEELSGVEELSELSGVEELDDLEEIEELDDLEEIEPTPPKTSMPPPPPPRRK